MKKMQNWKGFSSSFGPVLILQATETIDKHTRIPLAGVDSACQIAGAEVDVSVKYLPVAVRTAAEGVGDGRHWCSGEDLGQLALPSGVAPAGDDALGRHRRPPLGDAERLDLTNRQTGAGVSNGGKVG